VRWIVDRPELSLIEGHVTDVEASPPSMTPPPERGMME
jgi:hypothetical protein